MTAINHLKIEAAKIAELNEIFDIYLTAKAALEANGLFQWTDKYPTIALIENDIKKTVLYLLKNNEKIVGAINLSEDQEMEYQTIKWEFNASKVLVIHRLVIHPTYQKQGYGSNLMDFAENFAVEKDYTAIRLDAYSQNKNVIHFYKNRGYFIRGDVNFPARVYPFHCMEKEVLGTVDAKNDTI